MSITCKKCGGEIFSRKDLKIREVFFWCHGGICPIIPFTLNFFHSKCFFSRKKSHILFNVNVIKYSGINSLITRVFLSTFPFFILLITFPFLVVNDLNMNNLILFICIPLFFAVVYSVDIYKLIKIKRFLNK